jgi:hypothetical protein
MPEHGMNLFRLIDRTDGLDVVGPVARFDQLLVSMRSVSTVTTLSYTDRVARP